MTPQLIQRYQPGGDIYNTIVSQYSQSTADAAAQAALSGDETAINAVLRNSTYGADLNTSTLDIFTNQILTDPLAAPLASAESLLRASGLDFLKSPAVLITIGIAAFFALGGATLIERKLTSA